MQLLTGIVLASLFRWGSGPRRSPLLTPIGPIKTAHVLPGRARFVVERVRGDRSLCSQLAERLTRLQGVHTARISAVSGSVVVTYDSSTIEPALLVAALIKLLGLEDEMGRSPRALLTGELREFGGALNRAVLEKTRGLVDLDSGIPLALGAIGLARLARTRSARWPAATTMLWWAYSSLARRGRSRS